MNWENVANLTKTKLLEAMNLEERRSTSGKFFTTLGIFACGAIVGGAIALLLAPRTGEDLRKVIAQKLVDLSGGVVAKEAMSATAEEGKSHAVNGSGPGSGNSGRPSVSA